MNQAGSLRKRRSKTLSKVNGLSTIPYRESLDTFRGLIETNGFVEETTSNKTLLRSAGYTTIRLSASQIVEHRLNSNVSSRTRITRDPSLHSAYDLEENKRESEGNSNETAGIETRNSTFKGNSDATERESPLEIDPQNQNNFNHREHFLKNSVVQVLRYIVIIGTLFGTMPWKWNKERQRIERRGSTFVKLWRWQLIIGSIQTIVIFYLQLNAFLEKLYSEQTSNRTAFMGTFGIVWCGMVLGKNLNMYFYAEKMRIYLNALLEFNQTHVKSYMIQLDDYKDRGGIVLTPLFFCIGFIQIPVSVSLFIRMPFQPWYLFSYFYPKPWYWLIPGALHEILMVGQTTTFVIFIPWIVVAHTNSVRFWLCELHNNSESEYSNKDLRTPGNSIKIYKALHVLNILFNDCMAPVALPAMTLIWATTLVSCGYVMVRSMNHQFIEDLPGILSYPLGITTVSIKAFYTLSLSAEVSDLGCSFVQSWSQTKQKDFRRILMTCPTLKIWTGSFYFFSCSSTIIFFAKVFDFITNCIITFP